MSQADHARAPAVLDLRLEELRTALAKPSDAQTAYAVQRALVAVRLEELDRALKTHEAARPLLRGHVGDMERVEALIAETVRFLSAPVP